MTGMVFDMQRFSVHDGPGIRTTVFLKGCPLRCAWCHNPEGLIMQPQVQFFKEACIWCGRCGEKTLADVENCPTGALKVCGRPMTVEMVLEEVGKDKPFYQQDGGVTFSGGECLLQADFVATVLQALKNDDIHTAVDTAGYVSLASLEKVRPYTDLFLYDLKVMNHAKHRDWTGVDNTLIVDNLKIISTWDIPIWIRIPVIPDVNDTEEEMMEMALFLSTLTNIQQVTLMPYHTLGKSKYQTLGLQPAYNTDNMITNKTVTAFEKIFTAQGLFVKGGA